MPRNRRDGQQHRASTGGRSPSQLDVRLQQTTQRMCSILQLGLRPLQEGGPRKWFSSDSGLQLQAVRAISAFVEALPKCLGNLPSLQAPLEEAIAALQGLLAVDNGQIYTSAADVSSRLVTLLGSSLNGFGGECLVVPIVSLLSLPKSSAFLSAASALKGIIEGSTSRIKRTSIGTSTHQIWKLLETSNALGRIISLLESAPHEARVGGAMLTALTKLLAVILEVCPMTRYTVGSRSPLRETLFSLCLRIDDDAAFAALRVFAEVALCSGVVALITNDPKDAWSAIMKCLNNSRKCSIQIAALHVFVLFGGFLTFDHLMDEKELAIISSCCIKVLRNSWICCRKRGSSDMEFLAMQMADATNRMLLQDGKHHTWFLHAGVLKAIHEILFFPRAFKPKINSPEDEVYHHDSCDPQVMESLLLSTKKQSSQVRILLWEAFGWLGVHCQVEAEELIKKDAGSANAFKELTVMACNAVVRSVIRRGQMHSSHQQMVSSIMSADDQLNGLDTPITDQEAAQMYKTVLILLSSSSQYCSETTRYLLDHKLQKFEDEPFTFIVNSLAVGYKGTSEVKSEKVLTLTRLWAVSSLSYLPQRKSKLLDAGGANVVFQIIREHCKAGIRVTGGTGPLISSLQGYSLQNRSCCSCNPLKWEGDDDILFAALFTFVRLFQGSDWSLELTRTLSQGNIYQLVSTQNGNLEPFSLLWKLAGNKEIAAGIRWCASYGLACLGLYGFPSKFGENLKLLLNDRASSDLTFVFANGSHLHCHRTILLARCPFLLPSFLQPDFSKRSRLIGFEGHDDQSAWKQDCVVSGDNITGPKGEFSAVVRSGHPVKVQVSARLSYEAMKYILEFIYGGITQVDIQSLPDVKVLAKRCRLEILSRLLNGKTNFWGAVVPQCGLGSLLGNKGYNSFDIVFQADSFMSKHEAERCDICELTADHVHAHRLVLSAQCEFFQALFRSGMCDSTKQSLQIHKRKEVVEQLVQYLYCGELFSASKIGGDCAWNHLATQNKLLNLQQLVELAELAEEWLLADLELGCFETIIHYVKLDVSLCPMVMSHAAVSGQWAMVEELAEIAAPMYTQMRDSGALDGLKEELREIVRTAHVRISLAAS